MILQTACAVGPSGFDRILNGKAKGDTGTCKPSSKAMILKEIRHYRYKKKISINMYFTLSKKVTYGELRIFFERNCHISFNFIHKIGKSLHYKFIIK